MWPRLFRFSFLNLASLPLLALWRYFWLFQSHDRARGGAGDVFAISCLQPLHGEDLRAPLVGQSWRKSYLRCNEDLWALIVTRNLNKLYSRSGAIPFRSFYTASLISEEGITGVVAVNEPYELKLCSHQEEGWRDLGVLYIAWYM